MPRTQTGRSKPFACPLCPKRYTSKQTKRNHVIEVHQNAGRHRCQHCDRSFQLRSNLENHERSHTGEKPFRCKFCPAKFSYEANREHHRLDQHAEKKFRCETCGLLFGRMIRLRRHLISHSTEELFHCEHCPSKFFSRESLRKHHLDQHAEKKFKCGALGNCAFGRERTPRPHQTDSDRHQARQHPATKREPSGPRNQIQGEDQKRRVVQPNSRSGPSSTPYNLRTRDKASNYTEYQDDIEFEESNESRSSGESECEFQDSESNQESSQESRNPAQSASRVITFNADESDQNDEMPSNPWTARRNDVTDEEDPNRNRSSEVPSQPCTMNSANLKLVYDVEYRAPE